MCGQASEPSLRLSWAWIPSKETWSSNPERYLGARLWKSQDLQDCWNWECLEKDCLGCPSLNTCCVIANIAPTQDPCAPWSQWKLMGSAIRGHTGHHGFAPGSVAACLHDRVQVPSLACLSVPSYKTPTMTLSCPWPAHGCTGWKGQWGHQVLACCVHWYTISSLCYRVLWWLFLTMKRSRRNSSSSGSTGIPASPRPSKGSLTSVWAGLPDCDGWVGLITSGIILLYFQYTRTQLKLQNLAWGKAGRSRLICWLQILSGWGALVGLIWCLPSVGTCARTPRYIKEEPQSERQKLLNNFGSYRCDPWPLGV